MIKKSVLAALVLLLSSGCGVFKKDWTIPADGEYCETQFENHMGPGQAFDVSGGFLNPGAISGGSWNLTIDEIESSGQRVWGRVGVNVLPSSVVHTECLMFQRADDELGEVGIEIFMHSEEGDCQTDMNEDWRNDIRNGNCGTTHMGGWKAF